MTLYCFSSVRSILFEQAHLQERLASFAAHNQRVTSGVARLDGREFLPASSAAIARAELLKQVSGQISAAGGRVISSSIDQDAGAKDTSAVKVRSEFSIGNPELQRLLYNIESAVPFLFIDRIVIRSATDASAPFLLNVDMTVTGLWHEQHL
jgi:hypothetical protein